jgi:hypothetical protein
MKVYLPSPAPTVTVTATLGTNQSALHSLRKQISVLQSKLKLICQSKPKPKGC